MAAGSFQLGENVFIANRDTLWVDVSVATLNVEPSNHFFDIFRDEQSVSLPWRLECKGAFISNPIVFEVVPTPPSTRSHVLHLSGGDETKPRSAALGAS